MKYSEMFSGAFVVRTRELRGAPQLSGEIIYILEVKADGIVAQLTKECAPVGNPFAIGSAGDDGFWYDVTELVLEANHKIAPSMDEVAYQADVTVSYRNELGLDKVAQPLEPQQAEDTVCLIGNTKDGKTAFSKAGYYVVASDSKGYMIAYQGYCGVAGKPSNEAPKLVVLNLNGLPRKMYAAKPIVDACNQAYAEDVGQANYFTEQIIERTIASAGDSSLSRGKFSSVPELRLEGAAC